MKKGLTLRGEIQRVQNIPQQYQKGWTEFYKLRFKLTPDVLIPRPETELLVDEVLKYVKSSLATRHSSTRNEKRETRILDVGTGSGCIAVSVAKNSQANVLAIDISEKALEIAKLNTKLNHVEKQIVFLQQDLLANIKTSPDIIVANLPYIPSGKLMFIDPMVKDFEPNIALDGGIDGYELYRRMFAQIIDQKIFPKLLICEIEETQGQLALDEAKKYFPKAFIELKKDLAGKDRILKITF